MGIIGFLQQNEGEAKWLGERNLMRSAREIKLYGGGYAYPSSCLRKGSDGVTALGVEIRGQMLEISVTQRGCTWQLLYFGYFTIFWEEAGDLNVRPEQEAQARYFDGAIDEMAMHDRALSASEIQQGAAAQIAIAERADREDKRRDKP